MFKLPNLNELKSEDTNSKGGRYKKKAIVSIPEYEPDTEDFEWDKNHTPDSIIR
jgi:hypothetical protein